MLADRIRALRKNSSMNNQPIRLIDRLSDRLHPTSSSFIKRYHKFLFSKETIVAFLNGILLLAGFCAFLVGRGNISRWLYLSSAVIGGMPLFILSAKGLIIHHDITAGVMASTAMIAAIIVGEYSAAAIVVFMFAIGDWLENLTIARADNALRDLARLIPANVTVRRNQQDLRIPIEDVIIKDIVLTRSGERIAVDGIVISGNGSVNQSAITGESMPVEKKVGDEVFAGTLNEVGTIEIQVTRLGSETTLGQIVKLVKDAQASQAPVQRIANRYAKILVPITFTIAIIVFLLSGQILRGITILVVVCPCALVLATPTAVVAAIGNAAKMGILVKTGDVIERAGKIDAIAFDKTGTLTYGKPVVNKVISLNGVSPDQILSLAAATERNSEHPIARSIVQACNERQIVYGFSKGFTALPGFGVTAEVANHLVTIGNRSLLHEKGVEWTPTLDEKVSALENQAQTVIPVAIDGQVSGLITLADTPRVVAKPALDALRRLGIKEIVMITGDNHQTSNMIAKELGIDLCFAEVLPKDKLKIIRDLQREHKMVAFVGDGVNDAPALAAADIGIAMGVGGTDVALETADIGLMSDEIERIPQIIELSRRSIEVIHQNIIFSMSMNVLSVFLGGFGIIGPVFGALMHETSALPVLANSVRLINFKE